MSPPALVSDLKTGLTFTDILFGFVIRELFIRLQDWGQLTGFVRSQLIVSTVLVLGSWIGFRRSLNRSDYELKFFNIPLFRFVLDQVMVVLYFRVAVLTPDEPDIPVDPGHLVDATLETVLAIFVLYVLWDSLGIWMAFAKDRGTPPGPGDVAKKYPEHKLDVWGLVITLAAMFAFAVLWLVPDPVDVTASQATSLLIIAAVLLLAYRWAKEIKNSWRNRSSE